MYRPECVLVSRQFNEPSPILSAPQRVGRPGDGLRSALNQLFYARLRFGQRNGAVGDRKQPVDAAIVKRFRAGRNGAGEHDHGNPSLRLRPARDASRHLAKQRLAIGAPLPGEHEVGIADAPRKAEQVEHGVDAGLELRMREGVEPRAQSAGRARAVTAVNVLADVALLAVFVLSCMSVVSSSYNPFIYFQF